MGVDIAQTGFAAHSGLGPQVLQWCNHGSTVCLKQITKHMGSTGCSSKDNCHTSENKKSTVCSKDMEPGKPRLKSAVTFADTTKDNIGWH